MVTKIQPCLSLNVELRNQLMVMVCSKIEKEPTANVEEYTVEYQKKRHNPQNSQPCLVKITISLHSTGHANDKMQQYMSGGKQHNSHAEISQCNITLRNPLAIALVDSSVGALPQHVLLYVRLLPTEWRISL